MNVRVFLLALLLAAPLWAQGFAGLGQRAEGFATPSRDTVLAFPQDHGAHPAYRIEWWYLTANLTGADGQDYGVQWTLFRSALAPEGAEGWASPQLWLGNAAVTTPQAHYMSERLARGGIGQAGAKAEPVEVWIDDWQLVGPDINHLNMRASGEAFTYDLTLTAEGPLVLHGQGGYSVKSASGQASHYYSQPFYRVTGMLDLPQGPVQVTGQAWLDREWSSQPLEENQKGWDWVSLHFDSGAKLMGFQLRQADGSSFTSGSWIGADGTVSPFTDGALRMTPLRQTQVAGRSLPTRWRVELPARGVDVTIEAANPQAWMGTLFPYWEGPVVVSGSENGRGYLEMTGY